MVLSGPYMDRLMAAEAIAASTADGRVRVVAHTGAIGDDRLRSTREIDRVLFLSLTRGGLFGLSFQVRVGCGRARRAVAAMVAGRR